MVSLNVGDITVKFKCCKLSLTIEIHSLRTIFRPYNQDGNYMYSGQETVQ